MRRLSRITRKMNIYVSTKCGMAPGFVDYNTHHGENTFGSEGHLSFYRNSFCRKVKYPYRPFYTRHTRSTLNRHVSDEWLDRNHHKQVPLDKKTR